MVVQLGVGDDAARTVLGVGGVDFGHYQGYVGVHAEGAGVVYHHGSVFGDGLGELFRCACACGSESDVHTFKVIVVLQEFDLDLFAAEGIFGTGAAFRTEQN